MASKEFVIVDASRRAKKFWFLQYVWGSTCKSCHAYVSEYSFYNLEIITIRNVSKRRRKCIPFHN